MTSQTKRNIGILFFAQAVLGSQIPIHVILAGLSGAYLAENPALATLPVSVGVLSCMFSAPLISLFMGRFGRRSGFIIGCLAGAAGGALCAIALFQQQFWLFLIGNVMTGIYQAAQGFYRFAAADTASDEMKPKAISWVMAGGLIAALLGGELVQWTRDYFNPVPFAGTYAVVVLINLASIFVLWFLDIPVPRQAQGDARSGRPLAEIFRQPKVIVAALCGMISFGLMSLVMTSTPLAMVAYGFNPDHAADVVRWHVFAMYAPSFFTGTLISRFGHLKIISCGLVLLAGCGLIALSGIALHQFYLALIALGVGWNFGFIGATSLLASAHRPEEQAKVQGLNDFLVFGLVTIASFSSGALLNGYGWSAVQLAMLPGLIVAALAIVWLAWMSKPIRASGL